MITPLTATTSITQSSSLVEIFVLVPITRPGMVVAKSKAGINVPPSSERGEGSASHRTASSSEVPRHT